jgi:hypothetical protein
MTGLYFPCSTNSFKKITSPCVIFGIGNKTLLPPAIGVMMAYKTFSAFLPN